MKAILNGSIVGREELNIKLSNRGLQYGDAVFETMRGNASTVYFWEDHYFRLMASMRILRMPIPMEFTPDYLNERILELIEENHLQETPFSVKILVWREAEGKYTPRNSKVGFFMSIDKLDTPLFTYNEREYEVNLFRDHYVHAGMLSNVKTTNRLVNVLGSIYASENDYANCLLLNDKKHVAEALNANLFLVSGYKIRTPKLESGCINGMMRKQVIKIIGEWPDYILEEDDISPFELQKAEEMFLTNSLMGIQPVSKYRKKEYNTKVSKLLHEKLNAKLSTSEFLA